MVVRVTCVILSLTLYQLKLSINNFTIPWPPSNIWLSSVLACLYLGMSMSGNVKRCTTLSHNIYKSTKVYIQK